MAAVNGAATLLADLARLGIRLEPRGNRLAYFPQSRMTPDLLARLRRAVAVSGVVAHE